MDVLISLLTTLNSLSPLAVIALLGVVIYMLVKGQTGQSNLKGQVTDLGENHLHEVLETLQRIEVSMSENFAYLRARINGKN